MSLHLTLFRALAAAIAVVMIGSQSALALNEFAASQTVDTSSVFDGLKGNMGIRTDPNTVVGVAYVHIAQADTGAPGGDFIAIGTVNGMGTAGGSHSCVSDYDPLWGGYYDGVVGGIYFCYNFSSDTWTTGSNPVFKLQYTVCPDNGLNRWVLSFGAFTRACVVNLGTSAQGLNVGLETLSVPDDPTDRNIDVKHTGLYRHETGGGSWLPLGHPPDSDFIIWPDYDYAWVSDKAQNFFKPPLD